jgi:hypothetical protein
MSKELDLTRVPRGEMAARALVDALVETDDRAERHYLEMKSEVDLSTRADQAKGSQVHLGCGKPDAGCGRTILRGTRRHGFGRCLGISGRDPTG